MSRNSNFNRNRHDGSDNNNQSSSKVHGGEMRNGRLSQVKNNNPLNEDIPNEYINKAADEEEQDEERRIIDGGYPMK